MGGGLQAPLPRERRNVKSLFITGGAGFLGRAILRRLDSKVKATVYSRDHSKHSICQKAYPKVSYILGDIRDKDRLEAAMAGHDTVIHAAAFKYVPQAESNVSECLAVNIDGSRNVINAAIRNGVNQVIGTSTDKACWPINIYGISKLAMERLFIEGNSMSQTKFNIVRYGNVVSSTGSVIPMFRKQIYDEKVTRLTNPSMTRFWLSVGEAVDLILLALKEKQGGTVLIPRIGSMTMKNVAECIWEYEVPKGEHKFETIGIRPGEKQHEMLISPHEIHRAEIQNGLMRLHPRDSISQDIKVAEAYGSDNPDKKLITKDMFDYLKQADEEDALYR